MVKTESMSTVKIDEVYAMGGDTMGKDPSKIKRYNVELNLGCAEDIEKVASMAINTLKQGDKGKDDRSKKISNEEVKKS